MNREELLAIEEHFIGQAWMNPSVYENLVALCNFGSRFAGTPSEKAAREWLLQRFQGIGLQTVHPEWYTYKAWERGKCEVTVISPQRHPLSSALALVYSPATQADGLEAEVVDLGHGSAEDFAAHAGQIAGNTVLVDSGTPYGHVRRIHRREKYMRAVSHGACGFLFNNHLPGQLAPTGSLQPGEEAEIPAVGLSLEDGRYLARLSQQGAVRVNTFIDSHTFPAKAAHIVGDVPAAHDGPHILIGAHYDGHDLAESAVDNGTGVAMLLALAEMFAPLAGKLAYSLRFVAFATEELGLVGSTQYVEQHRQELQQIALMINLDSGVDKGLGGFVYNGFEPLGVVIRKIMGQIHEPLQLGPQVITASDNMPFVLAGVPALNPFRRSLTISAGRGYGHTKADTLDKVEERDLRESVMVMAQVLLRLASLEGPIAPHLTPQETAEMLRRQQLEETLRIRNIWPFPENNGQHA